MNGEPLSFPDLVLPNGGLGFSPDRLGESETDYASRWSIIYDTLRALCRKYPGHTPRSSVAAKVWIIGRTYATQI